MWELDKNLADDLQAGLERFYNGEPVVLERDIADGVWFHMDCPFEEDLMEPLIPVSIGINEHASIYEGEPEHLTSLADYGDGVGDGIAADIATVAHKAGATFDELVFEYSSTNSNPDGDPAVLQFLGSVPNDRVKYDWKSDELVVKEVYA